MEIKEFSPESEDGLKDLLVELQTHLAAIDPDHIVILRDNYRDHYFAHVTDAVRQHAGKIFLAMEDGKAIGTVICMIPPCGKESRITTRCPKCGFISDLVVTARARGKGVGSALMARARQFFRTQNCEYVQLCVSAQNERALAFYARLGLRPDCLYLTQKL